MARVLHTEATNRRYLLIKSWGCGFFSDVLATLGALLLAEITNRTPIIHWGKNSLFGGFENFFEPITPFGIDHIPQTDFFPPKWNYKNLAEEDVSKWEGQYSRMQPESYLKQEEVVAVSDFFVGIVDLMPLIPKNHVMYGESAPDVHRWLIRKYLRPQQEILRRVNAFQQKHLRDPYVAVHIRGSDKVAEISNLEEVNMSYIELLKRVDPRKKIFLLTDDAKWLKITRREFGDSRVIATDCKRTHSNKGAHHFYKCGLRLGIEVMIDANLASRADVFIGNGGSNVSLVITHMRDWPVGCCILSGNTPRWPSSLSLKRPELD